MKTIKQIADSIGVSKQRVYRYIKDNCINDAHHEARHDVHQKNITKYYDDGIETLIKSHFMKNEALHDAHYDVHQSTLKNANDAVVDALISMLKQELEAKNKQIADLTTALTAAQQTAAAAQALHAGTMKHISSSELDIEQSESKKKAWQFWKK